MDRVIGPSVHSEGQRDNGSRKNLA
jgi:hypothetical protein